MKKLLKRGTAIICALALLSTLASAAEMIPTRGTVHGSLWIEQGIFVNGVELGVIEYSTQYYELPFINGNVYIPLRTATELLGVDADWDEATAVLSLTRTKAPYVRERRVNVIKVEETKEEFEAMSKQLQQDVLMGIDAELRPDITLLLDGKKQELTNEQGETIYPILFRGVLYLTVRSVGELCGMKVAWLADQPVVYTFGVQTQHSFNDLYEPYVSTGHGAQIHLYDTPTEEQIKSAADYLDTANRLYMQCVEATAAIPDDLTTYTKEQAIVQLKTVVSCAGQLLSLSAPDAPFFAWEARRIKAQAREVQVNQVENYLNWLETSTYPMEDFLHGFKDIYMLQALYMLRGQVEEGQRLLNVVQSNSNKQG